MKLLFNFIKTPETAKTALNARRALAGSAVLVSIAYMDPGNFATNIQGGAGYGYALLWVLLLANAMAMLFQSLSARLGIVTGKNLCEWCRDEFPGPVVWIMWGVSEIAAMATDLAEFLGAAIGFSLLLGWPLMGGMVATAIITYAILAYSDRRTGVIQWIIAGFIAMIGVCYAIQLWLIPVDWPAAISATLNPRLPDAGAVTLAVGMVGATIMPHAIYLHSSLTQSAAADEANREQRLRQSNREVFFALGFAGLVNLAMVITAAGAFHSGHSEVAQIETAYHTLTPLFGQAAAAVFLLALLCSGISSSVVGTLAGQVIMQGFVNFQIPVWLRRLVTVTPAFIIVGMGMDPTRALILSQVVLSLALPIPVIALLIFTQKRRIMGDYAIGIPMRVLAFASAAAVLLLNGVLLAQSF